MEVTGRGGGGGGGGGIAPFRKQGKQKEGKRDESNGVGVELYYTSPVLEPLVACSSSL